MEKVLIVKVAGDDDKSVCQSDIEELKGLIDTAGGETAGVVIQKRREISPSHYIGKGRAESLSTEFPDIDLIVFDTELKPAQLGNLEEATGKRVIDRTQLILDIFAQRAHTAEGKLQVEHAQLSYILPRLAGKGVEMSRLGGGIGTRGPGETKLESDRRRIRQRILKIEGELARVREIRAGQRKRRQGVPVPQAAIVGYTNAGKTMLLNRLTQAGKLSEDKLFATLDPKIKHYRLPGGYSVLFSDTVGFIKNLPTQLVAAFRATLEEVKESDVLIHLIDVSEPGYKERKESVVKILKEIGAYEEKEIIEVYNKSDLLRGRPDAGGIYISAKTGAGTEELIKVIEKAVEEGMSEREIFIERGKMKLLNMLYEETAVINRKDEAGGVKVRVKCHRKAFERFKKLFDKEDFDG